MTTGGQLMTQSFLDYLMPSSHEVPSVEIVHHCTPSPLTEFGQKGSGESGYLGAPAAISGAVQDALSPWGVTVDKLPLPHEHDFRHHSRRGDCGNDHRRPRPLRPPRACSTSCGTGETEFPSVEMIEAKDSLAFSFAGPRSRRDPSRGSCATCRGACRGWTRTASTCR